MSSRIPSILCLLGLLLVSGCSMMRVSYNNLDTVASWMARDYFDLEPAQRDRFNQSFSHLYAWHRREQLPEYADFLAEFRKRAERGLRDSDILWLIDGVKARYGLIAARAAPGAAGLLAGVTPAQIEHLRREFDKTNREFLRENRSNESVENRRAAQAKRTLAQLRTWTGSISDDQERRIRELLGDLPLADHLRNEDRLRRQHEFLALLETRGGDRRVFTARLRDWLLNWEHDRPPALARAFDESWRKRAQFYAAVDGMLTKTQRAYLMRRLQGYSEDFIALAGEGSTVTVNECPKSMLC